MKINKRNLLLNTLSIRHVLTPFLCVSALASSTLLLAEKPPLTDPAFHSVEQLKVLHRDVRKPIEEQKRLHEEKATAKDRHLKIETLQENGADTHTVENRLVDGGQKKSTTVANEITTKHIGSERTSYIWAGNHQDIFNASNRNNVLQFNEFSGSMERANVRGEVGVTTKIGNHTINQTNYQLR